MIFKRVSKSIFFQSNKFKGYENKKKKDGKEVAKYLMVFNLLKVIHRFPGKKHLRT